MNCNVKTPKEYVTVYHYCRAEDWRGIVEGSYKSKGQPGLGTNYRLCRSAVLEEFDIPAVFAFLEPLPESWINNPHFGDLAWDTNKMGQVLLEIKIDLKKDKAFVYDRAYKEGYYYEEKNEIPQEYIFSSLLDAEKAYLKNKVSLEEYVNNKMSYNFSMPEVVVLQNIPLNRIKVSNYQPLIEEKLKKYNGKVPKSAFTYINKIGELKEWFRDYVKYNNFELVEDKFDILDFF